MPTTHATSRMSSMPTAFALNSELQARLAALAEASSQQPEQLVEEAVREYVERREEQRESLRQEGIAAWEEYQRTGLHLNGDEVRAWIDQIRRGERAPMPKCHV